MICEENSYLIMNRRLFLFGIIYHDSDVMNRQQIMATIIIKIPE